MIRELALVCVILFLIFSDLRYRTVHVLGLVVFTGLIIWNALPVHDPFWILINIGYLVVLFLVAWLYMKLFRGLSISTMIGSGDLWFIIVTSVLFDTYDFISWITFGLIFSLIMHLALKGTFLYKAHSTVPLIAYLGMFLIPLVLIK